MGLNNLQANVAGQANANLNEQQPIAETAGSIASSGDNKNVLFENVPETAGAIASAQGLDGQGITPTSGNNLSVSA